MYHWWVIYVCYYHDWSGLAIFLDEVAALRYAVENHMEVGVVKQGESIGGGRYPTDLADDVVDAEREAMRHGAW